MMRALILAAGMLALSAAAGSAQSVGVSAVIVEPVEVVPVEYEVRLGPGGYDVRVKRVRGGRSLLLERTIVEQGAAAPAGVPPIRREERESAPRPLESSATEPGRLLVTRVIAANA